MLQSIERYMKQAIVDKDSSVASAALTSSLVNLNNFIFSKQNIQVLVLQKYYQKKVNETYNI